MINTKSLQILLDESTVRYLRLVRMASAYTVVENETFSFSTLGLTEDLADTAASSPLAEDLRVAENDPNTRRRKGVVSLPKPNARFIYIFRLAPDNKVSREQIMAAIAPYKARKRCGASNTPARKAVLSLPKVNDAHDSSVLYVGGSAGNSIKTRLQWHMGTHGSDSTFGLKLIRWACEMDLRLELHSFRFPGAEEDAMQIVEDALWLKLKPLLGKQGGH